jgi:hypothetical protein
MTGSGAWGALLLLLSTCALTRGAFGAAQIEPVPEETILVKGAWSSAGGSAGSLPEGGTISSGKYANAYFGLDFSFETAWNQKYEGPPPTESGYYILAQLEDPGSSPASRTGHLLIAAQDLFFTTLPVSNAMELIRYYQQHLSSDYVVERAASVQRIGSREYARLEYFSPLAGLHWQVLATEVRCHVLQFIFTGRRAGSIEPRSAKFMPDAAAPACIKNYSNPDTLLTHQDPVFPPSRFNSIPVRIVIDKNGKVKRIHFLSAYPEQAQSISDALLKWRFKPYLIEGEPAEVETGLTFGRTPRTSASALR